MLRNHFYFYQHIRWKLCKKKCFNSETSLKIIDMYYCEDHRSRNKFKEDHLVLPVATPLPHHHSHNALGVGKSGYQHDVLHSSGLHHPGGGGLGSLGGSAASDGGGSAGSLQSGLNGGSSTTSGLDKYGDMSSLHLAHNRFLMPTSASDPMKASDMHHFTSSATNPFSIHR